MYGFDSGIIFLLEKWKKYEDLLRFHIKRSNGRKIMELCKKHGNKDYHL